MPKEMCGYCNPIAALVRTIKGVPHCVECGRIISEAELAEIAGLPAAPRRPNNSFEKGIRRDERGIPYLDAKGKPLKMKEHFDPRKYGEGPVILTVGDS